jgi:hypothetical protein
MKEENGYYCSMTNTETEFPKYQINIDGNEHWLPKAETGLALNSYFVPVDLGKKALEASGVTRDITPAEQSGLYDIADEFDAEK